MMPSLISPLLRPALVLALGVLAIGCGGTQRGLDGGDCPALTADMSGEAYTDAMACQVQRDPALAAPACREARSFATRMPADALRMAAECTLAARERTDGLWLAELVNVLGEDRARVVALAEAMPVAFDMGVHGTTFSAGLTDQGQRALGEALGDMSPDARQLVLEVGMGYALDELTAYAGPWMRELDPTSPAVAAWATTIDTGDGTLDETERWALVAGGVWSARDVMLCFTGERTGCEDWDGETPMALLEYTAPEMDANPLPNAAFRMMQGGELDEESVGALTRWLSVTEHPRSDDSHRRLMIEMTSPDRPMALRQAIASNATGGMCSYGIFTDYIYVAYHNGEDSYADATLPWNHYVEACTDDWGPVDLMRVLSAGGRLAVHDTVREVLRQSVNRQTDGWSCEDIVGLAEEGWAMRDQFSPAGVAFVEAAALGDGQCADELRPRIEQVVDDASLHPEAWLAAGIWLAERGDLRGCGASAQARSWYDEEHRADAGARALDLADRLDQVCGASR